MAIDSQILLLVLNITDAAYKSEDKTLLRGIEVVAGLESAGQEDVQTSMPVHETDGTASLTRWKGFPSCVNGLLYRWKGTAGKLVGVGDYTTL